MEDKGIRRMIKEKGSEGRKGMLLLLSLFLVVVVVVSKVEGEEEVKEKALIKRVRK